MARNAVKMSEDEFKTLLLNWSKKVLSHEDSEISVEEIEETDFTYRKNADMAKLDNYVHNAIMSYHDDKGVEKIKSDLNDKVNFDWENFYPFPNDPEDMNDPDREVMGIWTTESGITLLGCMAGGDWELPVYFVIYPETTTTLRAFIPKEGNTWNVKTKTAYGSEPDDIHALDDVDEDGPKIDIPVYKAAINKRLKVK
jgi:hypothetical protein